MHSREGSRSAVATGGSDILVPVSVNGHTLQMILDTGAQKSVLTEFAVQKWHIPQSGRTFTVGVGNLGGSMRSDADVESVTIGSVAIPVDHLPVVSYGNIEGVIGLDVLEKYDLDLDGPNRTLGFYRAHCTAGSPWSSATMVEGTRKANWLQMPIEIDGVKGMAVVDTGLSYTTIRSADDATTRVNRRSHCHRQSGKNACHRWHKLEWCVHKFHTIRLGPVTAHDVSILILPGEPPSLGGGRRMPDVIVGQDMLRNRHVWFSWSTGRLYL